MPPPDERERVDEVVIVSNNPETLDGLQKYLSDAGLKARCARDVDDCTKAVSSSTVAVVLFPDDYPSTKVVAALGTLAEQRPLTLPVLVTSRLDRFERLGFSDRVLLVPRPVWGWAILDAIRAHVVSRRPRREDGPAR
jgi:DNA-binding response OmpR family regulator